MCLCWASWWEWWVSSLSCPISNMCLVSCLVPYLLCHYMGMCLCGVSGWVYQVSSVLQYIAVSLQSVGMRVSSVKCLMSCPIICVLSCPIVCVVSIQMCLCWGSSVKSLLSVGLSVSSVKCQVSCPIICFFCVTVLRCVSAECRVESDECPA